MECCRSRGMTLIKYISGWRRTKRAPARTPMKIHLLIHVLNEWNSLVKLKLVVFREQIESGIAIGRTGNGCNGRKELAPYVGISCVPIYNAFLIRYSVTESFFWKLCHPSLHVHCPISASSVARWFNFLINLQVAHRLEKLHKIRAEKWVLYTFAIVVTSHVSFCPLFFSPPLSLSVSLPPPDSVGVWLECNFPMRTNFFRSKHSEANQFYYCVHPYEKQRNWNNLSKQIFRDFRGSSF